jgi:hypothetical protein
MLFVHIVLLRKRGQGILPKMPVSAAKQPKRAFLLLHWAADWNKIKDNLLRKLLNI